MRRSFDIPANLRIQFGDIIPYEGIGSNVPYAAGQQANTAVRDRWISYREDHWPAHIVEMSQDEGLVSIAKALMYVAEKEDPPATMLAHIREEITFYVLGLHEEVYPDTDPYDVEEALRLACITQLVLNQRDGYWNIYGIVVNTKGQVCESDEQEGTEPKHGYPVSYHWVVRGQRFTIEAMSDWMDWMLYYGQSYVINESVQGLNYVPLKNLVYYFRHYYIADLKGQEEAQLVTSIAMGIWYVGLALAVGIVATQLIGTANLAKILAWAAKAGPWVLKRANDWLASQQPAPTPSPKPKDEDEKKSNANLVIAALVGLLILGSQG